METPGEFVYGHSGVFAAHGLRQLVADPELATQTAYLQRVGFHEDAGRMVREVPAAA